MKVNELRVGNWVRYSNISALKAQGYTKIEGILPNDVVYYHDPSEEEGAYWQISINDLQPIPLTPEILEKAGFEAREMNNGAFKEYDLSCTPPGYKNEYRLRYWDMNGRRKIEFAPVMGGNVHAFPCEYLHQLQNLYYAITGVELDVGL